MMTMSLEDPHQVETAMEKQLEKHHHEALVGANALQTMADGLPALGIVAAVLGVIKTMGAISEPPEVLGGMIGSALVGTFLGVFLAYGIVGPMGTRLKAVIDEDALFYHVIRDILVAHLHGNAAQVSVEIGRGSVPMRISAELPGTGNRAEFHPAGYGVRSGASYLAAASAREAFRAGPARAERLLRFRQRDKEHRQRAGKHAQRHGVIDIDIRAEGDNGRHQHAGQLRHTFGNRQGIPHTRKLRKPRVPK